MLTQSYPTIAVPAQKKATEPSPRFLGPLNTSPEIAALMLHLDMSELNQRATLAYNIEESELKEVLLESYMSELHTTYRLATPQRLAKEFRVERTADGWAVVDGLNMIVADSLANEMIAGAICELFRNPRTDITDYPMNKNPELPEQNS